VIASQNASLSAVAGVVASSAVDFQQGLR
jgi:hypothetical protein